MKTYAKIEYVRVHTYLSKKYNTYATYPRALVLIWWKYLTLRALWGTSDLLVCICTTCRFHSMLLVINLRRQLTQKIKSNLFDHTFTWSYNQTLNTWSLKIWDKTWTREGFDLHPNLHICWSILWGCIWHCRSKHVWWGTGYMHETLATL
jgi:hypothetical protein